MKILIFFPFIPDSAFFYGTNKNALLGNLQGLPNWALVGALVEMAKLNRSVGSITTCKEVIFGYQAISQISTSHIERQNLTLRMFLRRINQITNAFSKKFENLKVTLDLHFVYYNFSRIHGSLGITPAMKDGITGHIWSIEEILNFG